MVTVRYRCRTGNQLFQYCFARILAEELGYALDGKPVHGFPSTRQEVKGLAIDQPSILVSELFGSPAEYRSYPAAPGDSPVRRVPFPEVLERCRGCRVFVDGFFEYFPYYQPYIERIRSDWIRPATTSTLVRPNADDLVVHVRRTDMVGLGWAAPWSYFESLLNRVAFRQLYVATDAPHDPFHKNLAPYHPIFLSAQHADCADAERWLYEFNTIAAFQRIALSSGTFGWWAALLAADADVYVPLLAEFGVHGGSLSGNALHVPLPRYHYVGRSAICRYAGDPPMLA
ncbi:MAG: hypothetical protein KDA71_18675 [Planctomycetales bacterium]|nr:hypothetical protein [Planctomycetales bacterium]